MLVGYVVAIFLGLVFGSFAGAQVWRLRARQLIEDKAAGEEYDKRELKGLRHLVGAKLSSDRSRCLRCQHELAWYDLIPLFSWISTKGRCRYCNKAIGSFEPLMELGGALLFTLLFQYLASNYGMPMAGFVMVPWMVVAVLMLILLAYDAKWFLLPDRIMFPLIAVSAAIALWQVSGYSDPWVAVVSTVGAVAILGGLYLLLWIISRGAWIGFGDVKLGVALGLLLGDAKLALLALFLANLIGLLFALPQLISRRASGKTQIPFGPMLILGFFIALFWGDGIIHGYLNLTNGIIANILML